MHYNLGSGLMFVKDLIALVSLISFGYFVLMIGSFL